MKLITSILLIAFIASSMKLSGAVHSIEQLLNNTAEQTHCCSSVKDISDCEEKPDSDNHEKDCCEDGNCHCICCLHLVYFTKVEGAFAQNQIIESVEHFWNFNYYKDFQNAVFHPPLV